MSVQHAGGMVSLFHMFILHRLLTWLGAQKGKTKAASMLCNMFRKLDVLPVVYLCTYKVAPDYEKIITPQVLISYKVMDSYSTFLKDKFFTQIELSNGGCLITSAQKEAYGGQTGEKQSARILPGVGSPRGSRVRNDAVLCAYPLAQNGAVLDPATAPIVGHRGGRPSPTMAPPTAVAGKLKIIFFLAFSTPKLKKHRFSSESAPLPQKGTHVAARVEKQRARWPAPRRAAAGDLARGGG
ncbi:hypothetical protein Goshw_017463 [Gossypium schwendimanii]|uniref:Uncharacterized protein n=1 Tax=Gossypium schwendimanii TaxID=34291 RepID=A0A7J9LNV2_GOSSC|nr:hypothetical protein [Gossypium schwendimanii]